MCIKPVCIIDIFSDFNNPSSARIMYYHEFYCINKCGINTFSQLMYGRTTHLFAAKTVTQSAEERVIKNAKHARKTGIHARTSAGILRQSAVKTVACFHDRLNSLL